MLVNSSVVKTFSCEMTHVATSLVGVRTFTLFCFCKIKKHKLSFYVGLHVVLCLTLDLARDGGVGVMTSAGMMITCWALWV